jgi:hypothetical protein
MHANHGGADDDDDGDISLMAEHVEIPPPTHETTSNTRTSRASAAADGSTLASDIPRLLRGFTVPLRSMSIAIEENTSVKHAALATASFLYSLVFPCILIAGTSFVGPIKPLRRIASPSMLLLTMIHSTCSDAVSWIDCISALCIRWYSRCCVDSTSCS